MLSWLTNARQSKVDSAIMFLNKSISTDKLDTASVSKAVNLLFTASLTDNQIEQIETAANKIKHWSPSLSPFGIRFVVFSRISESDASIPTGQGTGLGLSFTAGS